MVDALLHQGKFAVRGLTRSTDSSKAKALTDKGVEMVQGDLSDKKSLVKAMSGVHKVFLVTDNKSVGHDCDGETQLGKNAVDAAVEAGIQQLVWSALEDPREVPGLKDQLKELGHGHYVPHFESKAAVTEYLKKSGLPSTVLLTCFFYDNMATIFPYIPQGDGTFALYTNAPVGAPISAHEAGDIGKSAAVVLDDADKYIGKTVPVIGDVVTFDGMASTISEVTGKTLKYVAVPTETAAGMGYPGAADIANMFAYYTQFNDYNEMRRRGAPAVKGDTFKEWAQKNKKTLAARFDQ